MSEQQAEQMNDGSVAAESVANSQASEPDRASAGRTSVAPEADDAAVPAISTIESPMISPDHEAPKADAPMPEKIAPEPIKLAEVKVEPIKAEPIKVEPVKTVGMPRNSARLVMASAANDSVRAEPIFAAAMVAAKINARSETSSMAQPAGPQAAAAPMAAAGASDPGTKSERPSVLGRSATTPAAKRTLPIAAMLALALAAGVAGGALATAALVHGSGGQAQTVAAGGDSELSASVAKLQNDIATLKASLDQTNQTSLVELNKTSERLDKVEKTQGDLAKAGKSNELQKLSDAVERLRAAQASAAASGTPRDTSARETSAPARETTTARETTGSVSSSSQAMASAAAGVAPAQAAAARAAEAALQPDANAPAVSRLPVVDGWVLRDVGRGGALIEGRQGLYEVYAGDPVPGLGKVDAIRKQDGRWVVVTTRGLVVSR